MNENIRKVLKNNIWYLATFSEEPNAVPVFFKKITDDGKLIVGDVFLNKTLKNVKGNGKIAVSACDAKNFEGYQIKGHAEYITEGEIVNEFKTKVEAMFKGAFTAKGALIITPEKIFVTTPGANK